ncbi:hypothetical protein HOY82DRAFT_600475 [Tuber indicum]|nr:hypothetical protein HOY82DRAFT_600475 [Tuber indicum]
MSTSTKPTTEKVPTRRPRPASRTGSNKKRKTSQNTFSTHWTQSAFFDRPPHRWGILAYLIYQPREIPSHRVLDGWRRSLEFIANTDNDQSEGRRSRASELLARFREPKYPEGTAKPSFMGFRISGNLVMPHVAEESDSLDDRPPVTIGRENRNVILNEPRYKNKAPEPILTRIGRRISKRSGPISGPINGLIGGSIGGSISWCNSDVSRILLSTVTVSPSREHQETNMMRREHQEMKMMWREHQEMKMMWREYPVFPTGQGGQAEGKPGLAYENF